MVSLSPTPHRALSTLYFHASCAVSIRVEVTIFPDWKRRSVNNIPGDEQQVIDICSSSLTYAIYSFELSAHSSIILESLPFYPPKTTIHSVFARARNGYQINGPRAPKTQTFPDS
jgi:hypothetical protein